MDSRNSNDFEWVACDLCGADDSRPVLQGVRDRDNPGGSTYSIVRCRACGLRYTNPRPRRDTIGQFYADGYLPYDPSSFPSPTRTKDALRRIVTAPYRLRFRSPAVVPPVPNGGGTLLDLGCGGGGFLAEARRLGWDVYGVEPDARAVEKARALAGDPSRIVRSTAEDVDFEDTRFDCVMMWHVLEHVHSPSAVLEKVHRWLRPGGALRIAVPNVRSAEARLFGRRWFALEIPRHLYHFTPSTLSAYLHRAGFATERVVPQWFPASISDSIDILLEDLTGRSFRRPRQWFTYYLTTPVATLSYVLGNSGILDVTARRIEADASPRAEAA